MNAWTIRAAARWCCALAASLLVANGAAAQTAEPAGLVIDVQGSASTSSRGRIAILSGLEAGAELSLATGARVVVVNSASGRQFELTGPGAFRWAGGQVEVVRPGKVMVRETAGPAFGDVRLRTARIAQASISMRGPPAESADRMRLASPVSTWLLARPDAFRWQPAPGASGYRFQLTDSDGRTLHAARTMTTSVELPATVALDVGRTYGWMVEADLGGGRTADAWTEFGLAAPELRQRVERARPATGAGFADRVLYALLLEELGVREEATAQWRRLAAERPEDTELQARAQSVR